MAAKEKIQPNDFVKVWENSASQKEVEEKLGMSSAAVNNRVRNYRLAGIPLKVMPRGTTRRRLNVDELKELCGAGAANGNATHEEAPRTRKK